MLWPRDIEPHLLLRSLRNQRIRSHLPDSTALNVPASHATYVRVEFRGSSVIRVSAAEFQRNIDRYQDLAFLSLPDFTAEGIAALEAARALGAAKAFDSEMI